MTKALSLYPKYFADTAAEKDVYGQLINAFRLRLTDELDFNNDKIDNENINKDTLTDFNTSLDLAEKTKDSLLPVSWSEKSREEYIALATGGDAWFDLGKKVDKKAVVERYGDQAKTDDVETFGGEGL